MSAVEVPTDEAVPRPAASLARRGLRLLWLSVRTHPRPFAVSILGAVLFGTTAVGGAWVIGRGPGEVGVRAFRDGVAGTTVALGATAIVGVAVLRSLGVVARRYYGMKAVRGMQRTWFRRVTDTYLRVPLSYFGAHPTGRLLAHADADAERATIVLQPLDACVGAGWRRAAH